MYKNYGNFMEVKTAKNKSNLISINGSFLIMDMGSIDKEGNIITKKRTSSNEDLLNKNEIILVNADIGNGDVIGKCSIIPENNKYVCGDHVFRITLNKNIDPLYFKYYNNYINNKVYKKWMTGSAQKGISKKDIMNMNILYFDVNKQIKIGCFFKEIDELIELKKQELSILQSKMDYLVSSLLNKDKNRKIKIKDVFKITRGNVLSKDNLLDSGYPVYSSQTKNNGLLGYYDKYLFDDAITWTTDGANAGNVSFRKGKFYCTNVCGVLLADKNICNPAFAFLLEKETKRYVANSGIPKLMNNTMGDISLLVPEKECLLLVSNLIDEIKNLFDYKNNEINLLKQKKKYYLNKIFC